MPASSLSIVSPCSVNRIGIRTKLLTSNNPVTKLKLPYLFLLELLQFVVEDIFLVLARVLIVPDVIPDHVNVAVDHILLLIQLLQCSVHTLLIVSIVFVLSVHLTLELLMLIPQLAVSLIDVLDFIVGQVHVLGYLRLRLYKMITPWSIPPYSITPYKPCWH